MWLHDVLRHEKPALSDLLSTEIKIACDLLPCLNTTWHLPLESNTLFRLFAMCERVSNTQGVTITQPGCMGLNFAILLVFTMCCQS